MNIYFEFIFILQYRFSASNQIKFVLLLVVVVMVVMVRALQELQGLSSFFCEWHSFYELLHLLCVCVCVCVCTCMCRLLGALVTYFVIGAVIMAVKYNAAGSDIIPHKAFWLALPLLIKVTTYLSKHRWFNVCNSSICRTVFSSLSPHAYLLSKIVVMTRHNTAFLLYSFVVSFKLCGVCAGSYRHFCKMLGVGLFSSLDSRPH